MSNDITMTKCSIYYSLDVAINGDTANNWGGFGQMQMQIGNISTLLSSASNLVNSQLTGNDWLITGMAALRQANNDLYKNNYQSVVYSPNSSSTASAIAGNNPLPTVTPLFIQSGLGPVTTNSTMVNDIDQGFSVT
ncbi:unnamed protein product [Sphagnum balticum]